MLCFALLITYIHVPVPFTFLPLQQSNEKRIVREKNGNDNKVGQKIKLANLKKSIPFKAEPTYCPEANFFHLFNSFEPYLNTSAWFG